MSADLTVNDLAERWKVAPGTVRTWIVEGEAPRCYVVGKRLYRFRLEDVEAFERDRVIEPDVEIPQVV